MNIFFLDKDPVQCAQWMVDKHVVKMIVETAQLLSTAHRVLDGEFIIEQKKKKWVLNDNRNDILYKATHINHPSAIWARQSVENYNWLVEHLFALSNEYTHRYSKKHKTIERLGYEIQAPPFNLKEWAWTEPVCAMKKEFIISDNPYTNYKHYYNTDKRKLHFWKNRDKPYWIL